jgi:uncharacterized membrane protein
MNSWVVRSAMIALVAGLVAMTLPGVREWRASRNWTLLSAPDSGSLMVAVVVAIAMVRVFFTLDRRARSRSADADHGAS